MPPKLAHQLKEKENDFEKDDKNCTCSNCPINDTCIYAWSNHNTNNKCLLTD